MYPPGVTLYFERYDPDLEVVAKVHDKRKKLLESSHFVKYVKKWKEYRYFWIKQSFFDRIFLCDRMFKSHFPYALDYAIVVAQRRIDIFTDEDAFPNQIQPARKSSTHQAENVIEYEGIVQWNPFLLFINSKICYLLWTEQVYCSANSRSTSKRKRRHFVSEAYQPKI